MQQNQPYNPVTLTPPVSSLVRPPDPSAHPFVPVSSPSLYVHSGSNSLTSTSNENQYVPTTSCSSTSSEKSVLLCTGRGTVFSDGDISKTVTARILFDDGSMDSFITSSLREKLHLPTKYQKPFSVSGFGGVTTEFKEKSVVAD